MSIAYHSSACLIARSEACVLRAGFNNTDREYASPTPSLPRVLPPTIRRTLPFVLNLADEFLHDPVPLPANLLLFLNLPNRVIRVIGTPQKPDLLPADKVDLRDALLHDLAGGDVIHRVRAAVLEAHAPRARAPRARRPACAPLAEVHAVVRGVLPRVSAPPRVCGRRQRCVQAPRRRGEGQR